MNGIALITGGSRGLGRNSALHLARRGMDIVLTYRSNADAAKETVSDIEALGRRAVALRLDTGETAGFAAFVDTLRETLEKHWRQTQFDVLINNAGTGHNAAFADTSEAQFDELVRVHLKGPYFLTQALLPLLGDGGRIVNLSSGLSRFCMPGFSAYASMKGAIDVLTRYLAFELGGRGIRVNALAPGAIETDFAGGVVRDNAELNALIASQTPLGRVGLPDDIGGAMALLLQPENGWINGQRIEVSGGVHL